jgi:hypothetical protein
VIADALASDALTFVTQIPPSSPLEEVGFTVTTAASNRLVPKKSSCVLFVALEMLPGLILSNRAGLLMFCITKGQRRDQSTSVADPNYTYIFLALITPRAPKLHSPHLYSLPPCIESDCAHRTCNIII